MNRIGFRASKRGNGVGLTVLGADGHTLVLVVVPKFWWPSHARRDVRVSPGCETPVTWVAVPEGGAVVFADEDSAWHGAMEDLVTRISPLVGDGPLDDTSLDVSADDGDAAVGAEDPLWTQELVKATASGAGPASATTLPASDLFRKMWMLLSAHGLKNRTVTQQMDPRGMALVDVPELRPVVLDAFTRLVHRQVARRRPTYVPVVEDLGVIRGRVLVSGLVERAARRSSRVRCGFESLTDDHLVWQTIRAALAEAVSGFELSGEVQSRALECDAHLRDVAAIPAAKLLSMPRPRIPANQRELRETFEMARELLQRRFRLRSTTETGVLLNLKWVTSDLWENLLARAFEEAGYTVREHPVVEIFRAPQDEPQDKSRTRLGRKSPDLHVHRDHRRPCLVDAKYKVGRDRSGVRDPSMADQNQMVAYAMRTEMETYLVRVDQGVERQDSGPRTFVTQQRSLQKEPGCTGWCSGEPGPVIGWLDVPFPGPGNTRISDEGVQRLDRLSLSTGEEA